MIDAEQPYCADVDECNDERADFNKLDVRIFFSIAHNPLLLAALSVQPYISPSSCRSHCMKYSSICLPICCRCAETTPTASTRWVRSAASARLDSTAGRQTADASISTSQILPLLPPPPTLLQISLMSMLRCASSTGTSYCGPNTHCNNTIGSFTCEERNCFDGQLGCQAKTHILFFFLLRK